MSIKLTDTQLVLMSAAAQRGLLKLLETANIKLASVASDVFGVSGRAMLKQHLIEGGALGRERWRTLPEGSCAASASESDPGARRAGVEEHQSFPAGDATAPAAKRSSRISPPSTSRIEAKLAPYCVQALALLMQNPWRQLGGRRRP